MGKQGHNLKEILRKCDPESNGNIILRAKEDDMDPAIRWIHVSALSSVVTMLMMELAEVIK